MNSTMTSSCIEITNGAIANTLRSGFTPDKKILVLSDTTKDFELETLYNQITDGCTL